MKNLKKLIVVLIVIALGYGLYVTKPDNCDGNDVPLRCVDR